MGYEAGTRMDDQVVGGFVALATSEARNQRQKLHGQNCDANSLDERSSIHSLVHFRSSSGGGSIAERGEQEPDAGRQLGGRLLEQRVAGVVVGIAGRGVGDAPVDGLGVAGELGAHLAHPVTQADHPVETLVDEHVQVLGRLSGEVEAMLVSHHPHRVGVHGLGMATGAVRLDDPTRPGDRQRLGHLGPRAVAGAQEQHPHRFTAASRGTVGRGWVRRRPGWSAPPVADNRPPIRAEIHRVVGVPAIGRAAPRGYQAAIPQLAQVVRDQVLRLADQAGQLVHHAVAPGQLGQEAPTQGMPGQLQELRRGSA